MINAKSSSSASSQKLKKMLRIRRPAEDYAGYLDPPFHSLNNTKLEEIEKHFPQLSLKDIGEVAYLQSYENDDGETSALIIYYDHKNVLFAQSSFYEHWDSPHNSSLQEQTRLEAMTLIQTFEEKKNSNEAE